MYKTLAITALLLSTPLLLGKPDGRAHGVPDDAVEYDAAVNTQAIFRLNNRPTLQIVRISALPDKRWQQPGGLEGIKGWTRNTFRTMPKGASLKHSIGYIAVKNIHGYYQNELGVVRSYPDGTRFDEVLSTAQGMFEHRVRVKEKGIWRSYIEDIDELARPKGYGGLKVSCESCHKEAGTGGYGVGLVPGGDTVLSDPLDWELAKQRLDQYVGQ